MVPPPDVIAPSGVQHVCHMNLLDLGIGQYLRMSVATPVATLAVGANIANIALAEHVEPFC